MTLRTGIAAAACCLSLAGPSGAAPPPVTAGTWTGTGVVSFPLVSPIPLPGGDPIFTLSGTVALADGRSGPCGAGWWEDPSGLLAGVAFGLSAYVYCSGDVAFLTGSCVVTRVVTATLVCPSTAGGQKVVAELALVPANVPMTSFAFTGAVAVVSV
jgi:hypothetical protein